MKHKITAGLLTLAGLAMLSTATPAQESQDKSSDMRTVTGCLSAGDSTGEYKLTADDGSTWEVKSKTVKLADHVGHTVKVTGKEWQAGMHGAKEKTKEAVDPNAKEHGHMTVTSMSMVSDSCKM